jgi:hypothetical protein
MLAYPLERALVRARERLPDGPDRFGAVLVEDPQVQGALVAERAVQARLAQPRSRGEVVQRSGRVAGIPETITSHGQHGQFVEVAGASHCAAASPAMSWRRWARQGGLTAVGDHVRARHEGRAVVVMSTTLKIFVPLGHH